MPTYLKIILSLCAEVLFITMGQIIGSWLSVWNVSEDQRGPGDGLGMLIFGEIGMVVAGLAGIIGLVIFWLVMTNRRRAATRAANNAKPTAPEAEGVWPPPAAPRGCRTKDLT